MAQPQLPQALMMDTKSCRCSRSEEQRHKEDM